MLEELQGALQVLTLSEKAKRLGIDTEGKTSIQIIDEIVAYRKSQDTSSRACELVTGLLPEDPRIIPRFQEDQNIVMSKYGLPGLELWRNNPAEYEDRIRGLASRENIDIRNLSEFGDYYDDILKELVKKYGHVTDSYRKHAVIIGRRIGATIDRNSGITVYKDSLLRLTHEIIHGMQKTKYPSLPLEIMEYEAYLPFWNFSKFARLSPEDRVFAVFGLEYQGSVESGHRNRGEEVEWDNPEWFLRNVDGIELPESKK